MSGENLESRVLARISGLFAGPTLICVAGIHGNEPAGVTALRRVTKVLRDSTNVARGDFVALIGNVAALARQERFLDRDLNRNWRSLIPPELMPDRKLTSSEDYEQRELTRELRRAINEARGDTYLLDLHTTSGEGKPFTVIADSLRSRRFALTFPSPLVLGLEEHLDGTLIDCLTAGGHSAVAFEGGLTDDPSSIDNLEAAIWHAIHVTRIVDGNIANGVSSARARLHRAAHGLPQIVATRYHHAITPDDDFAMKAGWRGFDRIERGETVARDAAGDVRSPENGYLLMPLYQERGEEGFFIVREIRRFWLSISAALRTLRVDRVIHWFPGVRRDPADPNAVIVNRHMARFFPVEIFHLLGFKRAGETSDTLRMRRRTTARASTQQAYWAHWNGV